jgi:hypothetical protein
MSFLPDWDSITSANRAQNWCFWIGIVFFFLVLVFEMVSHIYSTRKDGLVELRDANAAIDAKQKDQQYQTKMTEFTLQIADANRAAAESNKLAEESRERAAEAERQAAEAQLALEQYKAPRRLSQKQYDILKAAFSKKQYQGQKFQIEAALTNPEGTQYACDIANCLSDCGWKSDLPVWTPTKNFIAPGILISPSPDDLLANRDGKPSTIPLWRELNQTMKDAGIAMSGWGAREVGAAPIPSGVILIEVGMKPN